MIRADGANGERADPTAAQGEADFRLLADVLPQLVWACQPDGLFDFWNALAADYFGVPLTALLGSGWKEVVHPDDLGRTETLWRKALQNGTTYEIEYRLRVAGGGYRWHLGRGRAVRDASGTIVRWFGTCTDIDDQKRALASLRDADRRKDEFLAMLAHELRNPLAPLRNSLLVLRLQGAVAPAYQSSLDVMERQIQHLTRMVDDLLDVSRITRGKIKLQKEPIELATVLARAVETSRPLIDRRRHQLTETLPAERVRLYGDVTRLAQVFANLLNNSAKYSEEGSRIGLYAALDGDEVEIRVRDTGIGIAPEMLPHIFALFTQAERALDRAQGGLGIGLSVVKRLVELHGGSVEAHSAGTGKGSEFVVRLPLLKSEKSEPRGEGVKPSVRAARPPARATAQRILVVDDNVDSAETLALLLSAFGHEVRTAYDGAKALESAHAFCPQVVLCDIGLPRIDGYEVARQLRQLPEMAHVLLVALTGYGQEEDRRRSQEAGFDHHFVKPVDPADLERLLVQQQ
jgi:two-component system, chemotaxis family, CheB/CheR fusion protein